MSKKDVVDGKVLKKGSKKAIGKGIQSFLLGLSDDQNYVLNSITIENEDEARILNLLNEMYPKVITAKEIYSLFGKNKNIAYEYDEILLYVTVGRWKKLFITKSLIRLIRVKHAHDLILASLIKQKEERAKKRKEMGIN